MTNITIIDKYSGKVRSKKLLDLRIGESGWMNEYVYTKGGELCIKGDRLVYENPIQGAELYVSKDSKGLHAEYHSDFRDGVLYEIHTPTQYYFMVSSMIAVHGNKRGYEIKDGYFHPERNAQ